LTGNYREILFLEREKQGNLVLPQENIGKFLSAAGKVREISFSRGKT